MRRRRSLLAAVLCGLSLVLAGCDPLDGAPPVGAAGPGPAADPAAKQTALSRLDGLTVAPWGSMAHYSRDRFPHWIGQGGGCDTRDRVLERDGTGVQASHTCAITAGTWVSPYDGQRIVDPQDLDVDHVVPLANAWRTGAATWTDARREQFANDLTRPQLVAVTASSNRSKGDQDPSQWKPPNHAYWCVYAESWVAVKAYWRLSVTIAERAAIEAMLEPC